jgi:hypothetical protein
LDTSAIDLSALALGVLISAIITGAVAWAVRQSGSARLWLAAAAVAVLIGTLGVVDLMREKPRETHIATLFIGIPLPILGVTGLQYAMRRTRPWIRWSVVFLAAFILLFLGLLIGAAIVPRWLSA